jgi:hypothetical protein
VSHEPSLTHDTSALAVAEGGTSARGKLGAGQTSHEHRRCAASLENLVQKPFRGTADKVVKHAMDLNFELSCRIL